MRNAWSWPPTHLGNRLLRALLTMLQCNVVVVAAAGAGEVYACSNSITHTQSINIKVRLADAKLKQSRNEQVCFLVFENWRRKSCTINITLPSCPPKPRDYPLQCKVCFHIKAYLNTCFDHICREFTKLAREWACAVCVYAIACTYCHCTRYDSEYAPMSHTVFGFIQTPRIKKTCYCSCCLFFKLATVIIMPCCAQQIHILLSFQFTFTVHTVRSFVRLSLLAFCSVNDFQTNKKKKNKKRFLFSLAMSILSMRKRQWMNLAACIIVFFVRSVEVMHFVCTMNSGCNANIYSIQTYTRFFPFSCSFCSTQIHKSVDSVHNS